MPSPVSLPKKLRGGWEDGSSPRRRDVIELAVREASQLVQARAALVARPGVGCIGSAPGQRSTPGRGRRRLASRRGSLGRGKPGRLGGMTDARLPGDLGAFPLEDDRRLTGRERGFVAPLPLQAPTAPRPTRRRQLAAFVAPPDLRAADDGRHAWRHAAGSKAESSPDYVGPSWAYSSRHSKRDPWAKRASTQGLKPGGAYACVSFQRSVSCAPDAPVWSRRETPPRRFGEARQGKPGPGAFTALQGQRRAFTTAARDAGSVATTRRP
jgi:hypothetical protein